MTTAEREALKSLASRCYEMHDNSDWDQYLVDKYHYAVSPEVILQLLALISTLELTLSNATRVEKKLVERIATLESVNRSLLLNRRNK